MLIEGIESTVEVEEAGGFSVWVHEDDRLPEAGALLARFRAAPDAPEFRDATQKAARIRAEAEKAERRRRSAVLDTARVGYEQSFMGGAWVPVVFVVLSVAVTAWTGFFTGPGANQKVISWLHISDFPFGWQLGDGARLILPEVRAGEVWRLITPIFLHGDIFHIFFNMMWLVQLGGFIETRFGPWKLLAILLAVGVGSNLIQYVSSSPYFGGMSGVNYGLFGFLWMKGKFDPDQTWRLSPQTVQFMLVWMVLCFTGLLGPVANGAHLGGLVIGAILGIASARLVPWLEGRGR